jgi:hypothetical protein
MSDYPEHAKLEAVADKCQFLGEFLEWLQGKYTIAEYEQPEGALNQELWPVRKNIEQLLADYFNINTKVLEEEKQDILEAHRQGER